MPRARVVAYLYNTEDGIGGIVGLIKYQDVRISTLPNLLIASVYGNPDEIKINTNDVSKMESGWKRQYLIHNSSYKEILKDMISKIENELMGTTNCRERKHMEKPTTKVGETLLRFLPDSVDNYFEVRLDIAFKISKKMACYDENTPNNGRRTNKGIRRVSLE